MELIFHVIVEKSDCSHLIEHLGKDYLYGIVRAIFLENPQMAAA